MRDLTGEKFGRLTVIGKSDKVCGRQVYWICQCECGTIKHVGGHNLINGNTVSCGCYQRELARKLASTHGMSRTSLYNLWHNIKQRCQNPNDKDYENYGGRGIIVCDEWQRYEPFHEWAMSNGYQKGLTIDRIDNNGNYEPFNCRWITAAEQARNKRSNHLIEFNGEVHCIAEWARIIGVPKSTLGRRLNKYHWSVERALTEKVHRK